MLTPTRRARPRYSGSLRARPDQVGALRQQLGRPSPRAELSRSSRQLIEVLAKKDSESDGGSTSGGEGSLHLGTTTTGDIRPHRGDRAIGEAGEGAGSTRPAPHVGGGRERAEASGGGGVRGAAGEARQGMTEHDGS